MTEELLRESTEASVRAIDPACVILFGSRAREPRIRIPSSIRSSSRTGPGSTRSVGLDARCARGVLSMAAPDAARGPFALARHDLIGPRAMHDAATVAEEIFGFHAQQPSRGR